MECELPREIIKDETIIDILKEAKHIAIVGLSSNPQKDSHKVARYLQEKGYKIIPIYPKEEEILGEKVYRSLDEVPKPVDTVVMFRKGSFASILLQSIKKRDDIKNFWLQLGIVNNEASIDAEAFGLKFVQDRCMMVEHRKFEGNL